MESPTKTNDTAIVGEGKDAPTRQVELPDIEESDRRAKEKQEIELLDSIATLITANGDNKYALKVLFADLPLETTVSWPVSRINEKLEVIGIVVDHRQRNLASGFTCISNRLIQGSCSKAQSNRGEGLNRKSGYRRLQRE